jgi:Putative prokaryotic signal transducing protein
MWTCPKCGSKVDASFDLCWSCGTSRDGVEDPSFTSADDVVPTTSPLETDVPEDELSPQPLEPLSDLVECYRALDLMQAKFLADKLVEQGIPAIADTEDMHAELGSMSSGPRVWVRSVDLPRARAWLEEYDRHHAEHH